jgi:phosphoglucosamine mutase
VGDRYVLAMLKEHGGVLGGETSGHLLCLDRTTTGDGLISALQVLAVMKRTGLPARGTGRPACPGFRRS